MTYPLQFREKVFATKDKFDLTFEQTSQRFDIPIRTLFRWQQKIAPCVTRDKPATKIDMDALAQHVDDYPDAYLHERAAVLGVTFQAIHCALKRLGISYSWRIIICHISYVPKIRCQHHSVLVCEWPLPEPIFSR